MTGDPLVAGTHLGNLWLLLCADRLDPRAAGAETTAAWRVDRRRQLRVECVDHSSMGIRRIWQRCQQNLCIRVCRLGVDQVAVADLAHLAEIHNSKAIADVSHDGQVMANEDERDAVTLFHVFEHVQDLGLHRNIESRNGLVAYNDLGIEHQRSCHRHALALPT